MQERVLEKGGGEGERGRAQKKGPRYLNHPPQHLRHQLPHPLQPRLVLDLLLLLLQEPRHQLLVLHAFARGLLVAVDARYQQVEHGHVVVVCDFRLRAGGRRRWGGGISGLCVAVLVSRGNGFRLVVGLDFDVVFLDADDAGAQQGEGLAHKRRGDVFHAVGFGDGFGEADHALELADGDAVAVPAHPALGVVRAELLVFLDQQGFGLGQELGLEGAGEADVALQLLGREFRRDGLIAQGVDGDNVLGEVAVYGLVALVEDDEEEIEARHDGGGHVDVGAQGGFAVVAASHGVGGREDGGARIEGGLDAGFGDGDGLLFHGFVDGDLVGEVHFVEFVDGADAVVGEHERTGFDGEFARFFVFDYGGGEAGGGGGFAGGVDGAGKEGADIFEELGFGGGGIADDADIEVAAELHAFWRGFVHAAHKLEEEPLFDDFVAVDHGGEGIDEARVDVVAVHHLFEVVDLGLCERL